MIVGSNRRGHAVKEIRGDRLSQEPRVSTTKYSGS